MATVLEFPVVELPTSRSRWSADEDLRAKIIELSDYRPLPVQYPREWHAFTPFTAAFERA